MNKDDLIAKLLDGTLSDSERMELDAHLEESPETTIEVRELLALEGLLAAPGFDEPGGSEVFRRAVEDRIATAVVSGIPAATSVNAPSTVVGASLWWLLPVVAFLGIGTASYFLFLSPSQQNHSVVAPSVSAPEKVEPAGNVQNTDNQKTTADEQMQNSSTGHSSAPALQQEKLVTPERTTDEDEFTAQINNPSSAQKIQKYKDRLASQLSHSDKVGGALTAKMLGMWSREAGNYQESSAYLQQALSLARETKAQELEAEVLGEMGLLEKAQEHYDAAQRYLNDCIAVLRHSNSAKLERWEQELQKMESAQK